jgi:hypothetical protein
MFENSSANYHELNAGAHRNSPKNLYAPALTWHLAFWMNKEDRDPQQSPNEIVRKKLDTFLLALCKELKDDNKKQKMSIYTRVFITNLASHIFYCSKP